MQNALATTPRLHACPWCGSPVHVSATYGVFGITCNEYCLDSIRHEKIFDNEADCILDWQRRFGEG